MLLHKEKKIDNVFNLGINVRERIILKKKKKRLPVLIE